MTYSVEYTAKALKALEKMDRSVASMLYGWIEKNLVNSSEPRSYGKALTGDESAYWRYRVGAYRIITAIEDDKVKIIIVNAAHRREVYK